MNPITARNLWKQALRYMPYIIFILFLVVLPAVSESYTLSIIERVLIYGILAMSLNLIFGYAGLLSLGHAAYFGLGGYAVGILTTQLGITSFWAVMPASILFATIVAAIFGVIALRLRGIYFLLVTLALAQLLYSIAIKWRPVTGGFDGLMGIPLIDLGIPGLIMTAMPYYYLVLAFFVICVFLMYRIMKSAFGQALEGIREDEGRMQALGYNTWLHKYIAFVIAGLFAGVAGVLVAYHSNFVSPNIISVQLSCLVMLMAIIGGTTSVYGPLLGAAVVVLIQYYVSLYLPEYWPMILGAIFILSVMVLRQGIGVYLFDFWNRVRVRQWKQ